MERFAPIATRESLIGRLKDWKDQEGWRQFFDTYWKLIYGLALQSGLTETEAQDVVQETIMAVAEKMKDFKYDPEKGSFKKWLQQMTRWRIVDQFRKRNANCVSASASTSTSGTATIDKMPDPESLNIDQKWEKDWQENILEVAIERLRRDVATKHYQVFDLAVRRKWPVPQVAKTVGVSVTQVYLIKFRLMRLLKAEVKRLETELV
jgi:RNA polymerase sigma factor (sigma-70 family)